MRRIALWLLGTVLLLGLAGYIAFQVSPRPAAFLVRQMFDADSRRVLAAQQPFVPSGGRERRDQRYDAADSDALLDIFYPPKPSGGQPPPITLVWTHGGGWVSGGKWQLANYARILAGRGFTVVCVDYTIAPRAKYPTPIRQVNSALGWLAANADRLELSPRFVLAGDSAGANISAQLANLIAVPDYAQAVGIAPAVGRERLAGTLLYCGPYDAAAVDYNGAMGGFLRTVLWSYFGRKDFLNDPRLGHFSVANHVTAAFPPTFLSVGNGDPLQPQSRALAAKLTGFGVRVDTLFFPPDYKPALPHEYQFHLDTDAGRQALDRTVQFLSRL